MIQHVHHRTDKLVKTVSAGLVTISWIIFKKKKKINWIEYINLIKPNFNILNYIGYHKIKLLWCLHVDNTSKEKSLMPRAHKSSDKCVTNPHQPTRFRVGPAPSILTCR